MASISTQEEKKNELTVSCFQLVLIRSVQLCSNELSPILMKVSANVFSALPPGHDPLLQEVCLAAWWENQITAINVKTELGLFVCFFD